MRLWLRLRPPAPKLQFFNKFLLKIVVFRCGSRSASGCELRNFNFSMNSFKNCCLSLRLGLRLRPPAPKPQFFNTFLLKIGVFSSRLAFRLRPTALKFQFFNKFLLKIVVFRCGLRSASGCELRIFNFSMNSCKNWCLSLRLGLRLLPRAPKFQFFNEFL